MRIKTQPILSSVQPELLKINTSQVISYFTLNGIIPNVNDYDWYWGLGHGQWGTNIGSPLDAADIIMRGANASIYIPAPEFYYTDSQDGFSGILYYETNNNNEHLGFYVPSTTYQNCISESDITFFTNGIIYIGENHPVPNKEIVSYYVLDLETIHIDQQDYRMHFGEVKYGIRHYRNNSSSTLPNNSNNS
jgi:hypothetical protein